MSPLKSVRTNNFPILLLTNSIFAREASLDLQAAGYETIVEQVATGWDKLSKLNPIAIILEQSEPRQLIANFCRQLRKSGDRLPVLLLMEKATVEERVACLQAGADDYLLKPYNKEELLERISIYLQPVASVKQQLRFGQLVLDLTNRQVTIDNRQIDLTMKEFELLRYLMSNPRQVLTREEIIENVWGYDYQGESNVIEVYIRYLRIKIENPDRKRLIQTVRGIGYVLREP